MKLEKKKKISEQKRKEETRKKILLGSYLLNKLEKLNKMKNEEEEKQILAELNEYLTEDRDRKLFNMLAIEKSKNETNSITSNL